MRVRSDLYGAVAAMHRHFEMEGPNTPQPLPPEEKEFRLACMREEIDEYEDAETMEDELDALIDLCVFALGAANKHGFHRFAEGFQRVIKANMKKVAEKGAIERGGKQHGQIDLRKPEGWKPANLSDLVRSE